MNDSIYGRLLSLFQTVGLGGEAGDKERAEVKAYAAAASAALEGAEQALSEVFADTMSEKGILMYCDLLNIESGSTPQETKEKIIDRLSQGFYLIGAQEFRDMENNTPGYNYTVEILHEKVNISPVSRETLQGFSELFNNYYPAFFTPEFTGTGLTFDLLESLGYRWFEIEELDLPFYVWEKLGGEED